jgi:hypothetical protein
MVQKASLSVLLKDMSMLPTISMDQRIAISNIYTIKFPSLLNTSSIYSMWTSSPLIPQTQKTLRIPTNTHPPHPPQNQIAPDPPDTE